MSMFSSAHRPDDWPCNDRENRLDILTKAFNDFVEKPSFATKEVLVTFACEHDLNQNCSFGRFRIDPYEGAAINGLYMQSLMYNITSVRAYVYEHIARLTRLHKIVRMMDNEHVMQLDENIKAFEGLFPPLKLFYAAYQAYIYNKDKELSYYICEIVRRSVEDGRDANYTKYIQRAFVNLLNDVSYARGAKADYLFKFSREELKDLFALQAEVLDSVGEDPSVRPLMGVLCTQISNFVLKSRNGYSQGPVVKYVWNDVAEKAALNNQVWMRTTDSLNDKREGMLMQEVVADFQDERYEWASDIDTAPSRIYHVCCFSWYVNDQVMKDRYGPCMYGFKNDRMVDLLSPIRMIPKYRRPSAPTDLPEVVTSPMNAQVIPMDVLYGRDAAREEFEFLCSIVDLFKVSGEKKKRFLEEIIQYWLFSVKDEKNEGGEWSCERERRYVFFTYEKSEYLNAKVEDDFFKVESSLYMFPDFVLGDNPAIVELQRRADEKRTRTSFRDYIFCRDCLMRDYDIAVIGEKINACPICGSHNVEHVPVMKQRMNEV